MSLDSVFTKEQLLEVFPASITDEFFDALYGDAESGAYDIELVFVGQSGSNLEFAFNLNQRSGACLACNLTYGLPQVFMRHPIINISGVAEQLGKLAGMWDVTFSLGRTYEESTARHSIPFVVAPS